MTNSLIRTGADTPIEDLSERKVLHRIEEKAYTIMSLFDEINERTQLPKPRKPAQFESIDTSSDESSTVVLDRVCKPKNPNLYTHEPQDYIDGENSNVLLNYNDITSTILETNGGDSHSNQAIEQRWKTRIKRKNSQDKNCENNNPVEKVPIAQPKKFFHKCHYKNNPLMRAILEQKMAELQVSSLDSTSSDGGKTIEDNLPINSAMLMANSDDPDFFFLRDTSKKTELLDDGFRFKHRGVKKTITPRQYLIHEVVDDDFVFKKKS